MNVDAMLARMDPHDFNEWLAEYNIEPWGVEMQPDDAEQNPSPLSVMRGQAGV